MDELIMLAFEEAAEKEYNSRLQSFPRHRFSIKFYWKMYRLFQIVEKKNRGKHKKDGRPILELYHPIRSKRRLVVVLLLLIMAIGGSSVASEPFIRWLSNFYMEQNIDHVRFENEKNNNGYRIENHF